MHLPGSKPWRRRDGVSRPDLVDGPVGPGEQPRHVHAVLVPGFGRRDERGPSPQESYRSAGVAAGRVRDTDGELREASPEVAFDHRCRLPSVFEHLVGVERQSRVEQALSFVQRAARRRIDHHR